MRLRVFASMALLAGCTGKPTSSPARPAPMEPVVASSPVDGSAPAAVPDAVAVSPPDAVAVSPDAADAGVGSGSAGQGAAFAEKDLAVLAAGSLLAFNGRHFAYVTRHNGSDAWISLARVELADAKGKTTSLFRLTVPFDAPINVAATLKPHGPKLLAALAGYHPVVGIAVGKTAKLPSGDVVAFNDNTAILTFTRVGSKPIQRKLDGGGVTTPKAHYAFPLGDPTGTVIVTTSYTGDIVFVSAFEKF